MRLHGCSGNLQPAVRVRVPFTSHAQHAPHCFHRLLSTGLGALLPAVLESLAPELSVSDDTLQSVQLLAAQRWCRFPLIAWCVVHSWDDEPMKLWCIVKADVLKEQRSNIYLHALSRRRSIFALASNINLALPGTFQESSELA